MIGTAALGTVIVGPDGVFDPRSPDQIERTCDRTAELIKGPNNFEGKNSVHHNENLQSFYVEHCTGKQYNKR